jgi:uncharacterized SAM-binding protein YcdF (DUF218 family)
MSLEYQKVFLLKKIAATLLSPVPLCIDILIAGLIFLWCTRSYKAAKVLVSTGTLLLLLLSSPFVSGSLVRPLESRYRPLLAEPGRDMSTLPRVKYIVVLAAGYLPDPALPAATQLGRTLPRVVEGVRVFRQLQGCTLIMSGGGRPGVVPESEVMAKAAESLGVDQQKILLESQSRDTGSEAKFVRALVGRERFILVTSASHMPRAMALFKKQGMDPIADPTDYLTPVSLGVSASDFVPTGGGLIAAHRAVYEYLAVTWEWVRGEV